MNTTIKGLGALLATVTMLTAASPAFAAEVGTKQDTNTQVEVTDNTDDKDKDKPGTNTDLQLVQVPSQFNFKTKLQSSNEYSIDGKNEGTNKDYVVFTNSTKQKWSVKSVVSPEMTDTTKNKKVDVTGLSFKVGTKAIDAKTGAIVMDSATNPIGEDGKATASLDSLNIRVTPKAGSKIVMGDKYTGTMSNTLFDTEDAQ
ncbi:hypothetical protein QUW13_06220 [Enterococcus hirae]|nr:hypothetical protein [Enterococcus hirae]